MKPHRVRMAHALILRYGLANMMEVRVRVWARARVCVCVCVCVPALPPPAPPSTQGASQKP